MKKYRKPMRCFQGVVLSLFALSGMAFAQSWEVGADGGYGFTKKVDVNGTTSSGASISGRTGFESGWAVGALFGNDMFRYFGGEIRYTYEHDPLVVSSGGTKATLNGESHALHYDLLIHAAPKESHVRPFLAVGGGMKFYRGTGPESAFQPLSNLILLTHTSQVEALISAGGGIKFVLSPKALFRIDFRDYMTPYPSSILTPFGTRAGGWIHNLVVLVGISRTF